MRNKIMALFIVLILVISAFPCGIIAAEGETSSEQYANEISFLQKIGVMDAKFDPQKTVTKAEFTKIILSVLQPNGDFSVTDSYEPVSYTHLLESLFIICHQRYLWIMSL